MTTQNTTSNKLTWDAFLALPETQEAKKSLESAGSTLANTGLEVVKASGLTVEAVAVSAKALMEGYNWCLEGYINLLK